MVLQPKFPQNPYKPIPFETPELAKYKEQPVTETEAKKLAKDLGCYDVIETSALTQHNLKEVFDEELCTSLLVGWYEACSKYIIFDQSSLW